MYQRKIDGKTVTATAAENRPGGGFFEPAFDVVGDDGYVFPRQIVRSQNLTHSSAAYALWRASDWLQHAIVDEDGRVWF
jgi:hypothetical protein